MSEEKRLEFLVQYHHSLSIQFASCRRVTTEFKNQINRVESEIESLLSVSKNEK